MLLQQWGLRLPLLLLTQQQMQRCLRQSSRSRRRSPSK
jgi:hypothetical protein